MTQLISRNKTTNDKFSIQEDEYIFPYHYIPHFNKRGIPQRSRRLGWSFDYLCYLKQVSEFVLAQKPNSILDVGCGDGRFLGLLGEMVTHRMGCDLSERAIKFAKAFNQEVDYRCIDANLISQQFDVVTAIEVLEHIPDDAMSSFVETLCKRTSPNGSIIICVPSTQMNLQEKHYRHYDEALLDKHMLSSGTPLQKIECVRVLRRRDILYRAYLRLTSNNFYNLEIPVMDKMIWNWVWNRRFHAERGTHIISVYKKVVDAA